MPIRIERVEPYIYLAHYEGQLTVEEMTAGRLEALAQEHGETPYVAIIDASNLEKVPFDARRLRKMDLDYSTDSVIIINPPMVFSILIDVMRRVMSKRLHHVDSYEQAMEQARRFAALLPHSTSN